MRPHTREQFRPLIGLAQEVRGALIEAGDLVLRALALREYKDGNFRRPLTRAHFFAESQSLTRPFNSLEALARIILIGLQESARDARGCRLYDDQRDVVTTDVFLGY